MHGYLTGDLDIYWNFFIVCDVHLPFVFTSWAGLTSLHSRIWVLLSPLAPDLRQQKSSNISWTIMNPHLNWSDEDFYESIAHQPLISHFHSGVFHNRSSFLYDQLTVHKILTFSSLNQELHNSHELKSIQAGKFFESSRLCSFLAESSPYYEQILTPG